MTLFSQTFLENLKITSEDVPKPTASEGVYVSELQNVKMPGYSPSVPKVTFLEVDFSRQPLLLKKFLISQLKGIFTEADRTVESRRYFN